MDDVKKIRQDLAMRMRAARENAGLSQGQVAKLLNFNRPTISEIEAGRRKVSVDELSRFSELYGVTIGWLTDENPQKPDPAIELAAREFTKLKPEDLDRVLHLLQTLKNSGKSNQ